MIESIFVLNGDRKSEPKNGQPSLAANEVYVGETVTERGVPPDRLTSVLPERVRVNYVTQEQENDDPNGGSFQRKRPRLDLQQNNQTFETQVTLQKPFLNYPSTFENHLWQIFRYEFFISGDD